jgi:hypothetical protein
MDTMHQLLLVVLYYIIIAGDLSELKSIKDSLRSDAGLPPCEPTDPSTLEPEPDLVPSTAARMNALVNAKPGGMNVVPYSEDDDDEGEATEVTLLM